MKKKNVIIELLKNSNLEENVVREGLEFLKSDEIKEVHSKPGSMSASDALATFRIRKNTTNNANIKTIGINKIIRDLELLDPDTQLKNYSFSTEKKVGAFYVDLDESKLIGVVLVDKKR